MVSVAEHENQARPFPKERQMPPISEKKPAAFARYKANQVKLTKFHDDLRNLKGQMLRRSLGADIKDSLRCGLSMLEEKAGILD